MKPKTAFHLLKRAAINWNNHDPFAKSATVAYYALFSLPSLLLIVIWVASIFAGQDAVQGEITKEFSSLIGEGAAQAIQDMLVSAALNSNSTINYIIGIGTLIFGATGVFYQLQQALNTIFSVTDRNTGFKRMALDRLISFGMIIAIGFLLLISLIVSTAITGVINYFKQFYPEITAVLLDLANFVVSLMVITVLIGAVLKILPDIHIRWKTTIIGSAITTVLFLIGKFLIGLYIGHSNPASVYGAASSIVLIMLWIYYTGLILFFGAEFTAVYANHIKEKVS
ncbi:YihY/virulence factor BrkB family protein [Zhouia sp. PK063]|uniref:YihY/virulence factor BrkB family protein n=1 Tax=Zhouia sp. PK063 TaxID=3373602 RepID=UPI0037997ED2